MSSIPSCSGIGGGGWGEDGRTQKVLMVFHLRESKQRIISRNKLHYFQSYKVRRGICLLVYRTEKEKL